MNRDWLGIAEDMTDNDGIVGTVYPAHAGGSLSPRAVSRVQGSRASVTHGTEVGSFFGKGRRRLADLVPGKTRFKTRR